MLDINPTQWSNKTILIVEDDSFNYQYLEALLAGRGLKLIHAKSGEDAVAICQSTEKIDLVLMDIQLPFMSGYEATKEIKIIRKNLPIIAQTAFSLNDDKIKCQKAGCDDYISKPIDTDELFSIFSKHLER